MIHLLFIIAVPFMGVIAILLTPAQKERVIRGLAMTTATVILVLTVGKFVQYDRTASPVPFHYQFEQQVSWVKSPGISLHVGVDGISLVLMLLTAIVGFAAVGLTTEIKTRQKEFYALLLITVGGLLGAFLSLDLFFLYFFHELAVLPVFLMIGIWGRSTTKTSKSYAAMKMTLYLSVGAFLALLGLVMLYLKGGTQSFDMVELQKESFKANLSFSTQGKIFALLLFGFGILVSLWPFHTWAPMGYGAAPTPTAMLHAGVLKKFGLYALIRIALPLLPQGAEQWAPVLMWLSLANIIYCGLATLAQRDLSYVIGYSSVMHMGYAFLGIASLTLLGLTGAVMLMFAHGVAVALAFGLVGHLTAQTGTRTLKEMGGLAKKMPFVATMFTMAAMAACGLPGFGNFVSEILVFFGTWQKYPMATVLAVWGVVLSAVFMLRATRDVFWGPLNPRCELAREGLSVSQKLPYLLLLCVLLLVGCWPRVLTDLITPSVAPIAAKFEPAQPIITKNPKALAKLP